MVAVAFLVSTMFVRAAVAIHRDWHHDAGRKHGGCSEKSEYLDHGGHRLKK
jgi:hypothetical protein